MWGIKAIQMIELLSHNQEKKKNNPKKKKKTLNM